MRKKERKGKKEKYEKKATEEGYLLMRCVRKEV